MTKKLTQEEFEKRVFEVHGNNIDLSEAHYINNRTKVVVRCIKHNYVYSVTPNNLFNSEGCQRCKGETLRELKSNTLAGFIKIAKEIHGEDYSYEEVEYLNSKTKVKIFCNTHKEVFLQSPDQHTVCKQGCPKCGIERRTAGLTHGIHDFMLRVEEKGLSGKYDFSKSVYKTTHSKMIVGCKEHGDFLISPSKLLSFRGCPSCAEMGYDENKPACLYLLEIDGIFNFTGFGITRAIKGRKHKHKTNLKNAGCFIVREYISDTLSGHFILNLETLLKKTFPLASCSKDIPGFKTESTTTSFQDVVTFVQNYIEQNKEIAYGNN